MDIPTLAASQQVPRRLDEALFAGIAARDERAMEALNGRFGAAMLAVARRVTRHERIAEEAVQEALLAVWRDPHRYDPQRGTIEPWLLTLTRYKAIDAVRRESVVQRHAADVDLALRPAPDDVDDEVWRHLRRARVREAMAALSADQRTAVELAFFAGLTHVEVADRLGIPLGTAKTRIRSALLRLRAILGNSLDAAGLQPVHGRD